MFVSFIKSSILIAVCICNAYSTTLLPDLSEPLSADAGSGKSVTQLQQNLEESFLSFIGKDGLFSGKYFKTGDEACDFRDMFTLQEIPTTWEKCYPEQKIYGIAKALCQIKKIIFFTREEIYKSHLRDSEEKSFENIHFIYKGKIFRFYSKEEKAFQSWNSLGDKLYKKFEDNYEALFYELPAYEYNMMTYQSTEKDF